MRAVNLTSVVVSVGAGGVDTFLERNDATNNRTEAFKKWADYGRIAMTLLGYGGQMMGYLPSITTPLATSGSTLLTKSILDAVWAPVASRVTQASQPRARVSPPISERIARSYQPEMESVGAF